MRTAESVLDAIYTVINVTTVTTLIDGSIYKIKRPVNSDNFDIVLNCLPIQKGDTQSVTVFINAYKENFESTGTPDISGLDALAVALITAIEAYSKTAGMFLSIEITDQNIMNDKDRKNTSYLSIRLLCYVETN